jgi:hypothetical protein
MIVLIVVLAIGVGGIALSSFGYKWYKKKKAATNSSRCAWFCQRAQSLMWINSFYVWRQFSHLYFPCSLILLYYKKIFLKFVSHKHLAIINDIWGENISMEKLEILKIAVHLHNENIAHCCLQKETIP